MEHRRAPRGAVGQAWNPAKTSRLPAMSDSTNEPEPAAEPAPVNEPAPAAEPAPATPANEPDPVDAPELAYHLLLDAEEVPHTAHVLRLLISDEAHEPTIRRLAREVLVELEQVPDERGIVTVALAPQQMKITHSALRLVLNDLQRGQADEREVLRRILEKLPDEHTMRAIEIK
jgi:hypothetical protein